MKSIEQLLCDSLEGRSCLREPTVYDWKGEKIVSNCSCMLQINCEWQKLGLSSGRSWFNHLENKNIYQEIANSINLGSKFYILPEKTGGCCANWNGSGQFIGNLMSWHCFPFLLNLMTESWWLSNISLEGNLTGLLILNFDSGSPLPNLNILTIPERHLTNHSPGWQYFKVLLMCK